MAQWKKAGAIVRTSSRIMGLPILAEAAMWQLIQFVMKSGVEICQLSGQACTACTSKSHVSLRRVKASPSNIMAGMYEPLGPERGASAQTANLGRRFSNVSIAQGSLLMHADHCNVLAHCR